MLTPPPPSQGSSWRRRFALRLLNASPSRNLTGRVGLGLAVGAAGGLLAHWAHVPLAFMLGSLFACMAVSVAGAPVEVPMRFRATFMVLIGLFLGESFEAGGAGRLWEWPGSIALAMAYVPVATAICFFFYAYLAKLDRLTALFSAIPGGLSAVVLFSGALGGDERGVALSQSLRIAIVVVTAPAIAFGFLGYQEPKLAEIAREVVDVREAVLLGLSAGAFYLTLTRLGAPLAFMVGPLLASATLRLAGVVDGVLPYWLVELALVVMGASIGCRFRGASVRILFTLAGWTLGGTLVLMGVAALFALLASALTGADLTAALLAFAPGGVAEMCLIAIALDADPGYVAAHHIARIIFILVLTPFFAAWLKQYWGLEADRL